MPRHLLLVPGFILIVCLSAASQPKGTNAPQANNSNDKAARDVEAARLLRERREQAQSLLISLAADAAKFSDQTLRARTQARIADALWELDRERSRTMFRSAWAAAEVADAESAMRVQEDIRAQQAKTGSPGYVVVSPPDLRKEVLRIAARRDRALSEEFLIKFKEAKEREADEATRKSRNPFGDDEPSSQRLSLAQQLLEDGEVERAIQIADPVLGRTSMGTMEFLTTLRERQPADADTRYAALLSNAAANPLSDANTVSLLTSYLFSPHLFFVFSGNGISSSQTRGATPPPDVAPQLRDTFFRVTASILLRPLPPPGQDQTTSGPDGLYLTIKRLMPLFEQYAPPETTTSLKAQFEALGSVASSSARNRDENSLRRGISPEKPSADREQVLLDRLEHAKTAAERDQLNLQLAQLMAGKGDLSARDYIDKIDDTEIRKAARAYIDAEMTQQAIQTKDAEHALQIIHDGELTHLQRSWAWAQAAKLLAKTDHDRALGLIEDAAAEARRLSNSDPDRPRAFLGVVNAMRVVDPKAAWEVVDEALRAANSAETFTGEDGELTSSLITKGSRSMTQIAVPDFDLAGIFESFAVEDYEKAIDLARAFQHDAPRANATMAIVRAILKEKKK